MTTVRPGNAGAGAQGAPGARWRGGVGSLPVRLTLAFVAVALVGIAVTAVATGTAVLRRFDVYVGHYQRLRAEQAARVLEDAYRRGGMDQVVHEAERLAGMTGLRAWLVNPSGDLIWECVPVPGQSPRMGRGGPHGGLAPWRREMQVPRQQAIPLRVGGEQVATLYVGAPEGSRWMAEELAFLAGVRRSLWLGAALAALVAVVVGLVVARGISLPLLRLREAADRLREGDLTQQVPEKGSDEMVALARAFNHLVRSLARQYEWRRNLTADVAHELRTPLAVVRAHIEAMQDGVWEASPENLAALHAEIMRLVRLVGDLEKLSEAESGALKLARAPVDLGEVARRVAAAFGPSFEQKGVDFRLEVEPGVPQVEGDEDRLSQVVWNLLSNALKFTPPGGAVTVRVHPRRGPGPETRQVGPSGALPSPGGGAAGPGPFPGGGAGVVCLAVSDTGPGIPPEELPLVFERFARVGARSPGRGTGLGLAISQALARAHGGHIEVQSAPGRGSTFTLVLPLPLPARRGTQ
jgi:signal transduction histidine kinase